MWHPPKKAMGNEGRDLVAANGKPQVQSCQDLWDSHLATCWDARHTATGFGVWPAEFWFCFGLTSPVCAPIPPFWNRDIY